MMKREKRLTSLIAWLLSLTVLLSAFAVFGASHAFAEEPELPVGGLAEIDIPEAIELTEEEIAADDLRAAEEGDEYGAMTYALDASAAGELYYHLTEKQQIAYEKFLYAATAVPVENWNASNRVYFAGSNADTAEALQLTSEDTSLAFNAMLYDHPEVFYTCSFQPYTKVGGTYLVSFYLEKASMADSAERTAKTDALNAAADALLAGVDRTGSDARTAMLIHDALVAVNSYDYTGFHDEGVAINQYNTATAAYNTANNAYIAAKAAADADPTNTTKQQAAADAKTAADNAKQERNDKRAVKNGYFHIHTAYDALVVGSSVCDGYAKAYEYLLNKCGIRASVVASKALNHAWSLVWLDNGNDDDTDDLYETDATRDDTYGNHDYYDLTTDAMAARHGGNRDTTSTTALLPNATGTTYSYSYMSSKFDVNYAVNGGQSTDPLVYSQQPAEAATPTIADPTRASDALYSYEFAGWTPAVADYVTQNATYTAQWTRHNLYTVRYNLNGGTGTDPLIYSACPDGSATPTIADPTRAGNARYDYQFAGWTPSLAATVTQNVLYTAQWNAVPKTPATPQPTSTATPPPVPTATPAVTPAPTAAPGTGPVGFVDRLYTVCLDRNADSAGETDWTNKLTSYRISGTQAAYGFVFSREFQNHHYSDADYVEHLYAAFMGRKSDAAGKADWVAQLASGRATREQVFYGFANSVEFEKICSNYGIVAKDIETFVTRLYSVCLDRKPDASGLADWSGKLRSKSISGTQAAYGFVFSKEFQGHHYSDADYVEHLYSAFMGRKSDAAGKADWVSQLASGRATREQVFDGFAGSVEFGEICAGYGIDR